MRYRTGVRPLYAHMLIIRRVAHGIAVLASMAVLVGECRAQWDPGLFSGQQFYGSQAPFAVAAADLNGDGLVDAAVTNTNGYNISVFLANAPGQLTNEVLYPMSNYGYSIGVGDLNGDGIPDLLSANYNINSVSMLPGIGGGTFGSATAFAVAGKPYVATISDFNGDGKLDIVAANYTTNNVTLLFGIGGGTLGGAKTYAVAGTGPWTVVTTDANGDGVKDLATSDSTSNSVSVLLGISSGGFVPAAAYAVGSVPIGLAAANLNNDSRGDLATSNYYSNNISVLIANTNGTFAPAVYYSVGTKPYSIAAGDLTGDHRPDLAVANYGSDSVSILRNNGNGTFAAPQPFHLTVNPISVILTDMDGDGKLDMLTTLPNTLNLSLLSGDGAGGFKISKEFPTNHTTYDIAIGDFNGDGAPDVAAIVNLELMLGNGAGNFGAAKNISNTVETAVRACDFNADGFMDLITANNGNGISILLGNGAGGFAPEIVVTGADIALVAGDFTSDGLPDVATLDHSSSGGSATRIMVYPGIGSGNVGTPAATSLPVGSAQNLAAADWNLDGNLDIAIINYNAKTAEVYWNNGAGLFTTVKSLSIGSMPIDVAGADANGDGGPDLIVAKANGPAVIGVFFGYGNGNFSSQVTFNSNPTPSAIVAGDLNADGNADLIITNFGSTTSVVLGSGGGAFGPNVNYGNGGGPYLSRIADLNGDGFDDIVTATSLVNAFTVFFNQSSAPLGTAAYGTGTAGCTGALGMAANAEPKVNTPGFGIACTNAPIQSIGLGIVTDSQDYYGSYLFDLGIKFQIDLASATQLLSFDFSSGLGGNGFAAAPIPNISSLAGQTFFAQSIWIEDPANFGACSHAPLGLVSSKGLAITIQQ